MFITWFLFTEIEQSQFRKVRLLLHAVTHTKITVCHLCQKNQYFQLTFFQSVTFKFDTIGKSKGTE